MTRQRNLDRELEVFMDAGPGSMPRSALENALEQVEHTPQRPTAVASWMETSNTWWPFAVAVAAAVLMAVVVFADWAGPRIGAPEASPTVTAPATPSASLPAPTRIEAEAVIPVPGAFLALADGQDRVWVTSDEQLVAIDTATGMTSAFPVPIPEGSWSGLELLDGSLWVGNYHEGVVYRLNPENGAIEAEIPVGDEAVSLTAAGGGIWVRTQGGVIWEAHRIDPATNTVVLTVEGGNAIAGGHGSLWFGQRGADRIIRADPVTGETIAVIDVPRDHDCGVASSSDSMWGSCFDPDRIVGSVVRIDPATNEVVATIHTGAAGGGPFETEGRTWLSTSSPEGGAFMAIDLDTNTVEEILTVGPGFDPDNPVIAGGSVWVANDSRDEVYRFALDAFGAED
jgi:streptogramin lyase